MSKIIDSVHRSMADLNDIGLISDEKLSEFGVRHARMATEAEIRAARIVMARQQEMALETLRKRRVSGRKAQ